MLYIWKRLYTSGNRLCLFFYEIEFAKYILPYRELVAGKADLSIAIGSEWVADTAHLERVITKTDQRMYCDKVEYYNRRGKKRETRHDLNDFRRMAAKSLPIAD